MTRIVKTMTFAIISMVVLAVCASCSLENQFSEQGVIDYLENKYNVEFTYKSTVGNGELTSKTNVSAFAEQNEHPDKQVFVVAELSGGKVTYKDNYVAVKYEDKTVETINKALKEALNDYKLVYTPVVGRTLGDDYDNDTSFEDYIKRGDNLISFDIILPNNIEIDYNATEISRIKRELANTSIHCVVDVYKAKNKSIYDKIEGYSDYFDKEASFDAEFHFEINEKARKEIEKEQEKEESTTEVKETTTENTEVTSET